ncbi:MAG: 10 kDa chaperonin [candidate division TA06 bacterium ADurb.Bin131]|jgi:chaperonin GroES|uniref:Co-chaperonin GroES n=1 Tax=candidate division TA06 bacterium ADurb.Bin131 TaxID=1852827 RepID=A0A1V6CDX1_UNCT6|nr:MAG: 10 kDa chaperonin [candidate division TA06 bacterium ADurb.Bin131]HOC02197.1 co-chaperone GroES [bacterium]HQL64587.1 co-chaperone GroES [bacterium]
MAEFKIKPLGDRVVVKPMEPEEKTKGGIIIPDTAKEKPQEGKVVAVGKGRIDDEGKHIKMEVKVDDVVLYGKYAGTEVTVDNETYMILREEDILGIVVK